MVEWEGNIRICGDCDKLFIAHEELFGSHLYQMSCELCGKVTQDLHLIKKSVILDTLKSSKLIVTSSAD